jgi:hypothetical protein
MGAGIAKEIKKVFPEAYEKDKETPYGERQKLGHFSSVLTLVVCCGRDSKGLFICFVFLYILLFITILFYCCVYLFILLFSLQGVTVVNLYGQFAYGRQNRQLDYDALELGLTRLVKLLKTQNVYPKIGTYYMVCFFVN